MHIPKKFVNMKQYKMVQSSESKKALREQQELELKMKLKAKKKKKKKKTRGGSPNVDNGDILNVEIGHEEINLKQLAP